MSGYMSGEVQLFFVAGYWALFSITTLRALATLTIVQWLLGKQPFPTWTLKALMITVVGLAIDLCLIILLIKISLVFLPILILIQPGVLALAWILLQPIDRTLKRRIYARAKDLRNAHPEVFVIGITGSVGKTTTKELLAHLLAGKGAVATPAYMNAEVGLARWVTARLSAEKRPPILIIEMGAYRRGEIAQLADITKPNMGIITFIGTQHIGLFGSQEALINAKGELLRALPENGTAILNGDSSLCASMKSMCPCPVITIGTGGHADLEAFDIEETTSGIRFRVGDSMIEVPLYGTHNVTNVLLAMAAAEHVELTRAECLQALRTFTPLNHTFSVRTECGVLVLDDTHNASAASFRAAIEWAREQTNTPKVLLTPGLIELGEEHERTHVDLGSASSKIFDRVIFTQKHGRKPFAQGFDKEVELYDKNTTKIPHGALLVCAGRTSASSIQNILPQQ